MKKIRLVSISPSSGIAYYIFNNRLLRYNLECDKTEKLGISKSFEIDQESINLSFTNLTQLKEYVEGCFLKYRKELYYILLFTIDLSEKLRRNTLKILNKDDFVKINISNDTINYINSKANLELVIKTFETIIELDLVNTYLQVVNNFNELYIDVRKFAESSHFIDNISNKYIQLILSIIFDFKYNISFIEYKNSIVPFIYISKICKYLNISEYNSIKNEFELNYRWKSLYNPNIPLRYKIPDTHLYSVFKESVAKAGNKPFLYFHGNIKTYENSGREVRKFASSLKNIGIEKGDRVTLFLPNCPQFVISLLSITSLGAVVITINPFLTNKEILFQLKNSGSRAIITLDIYLERIREIRSETDLESVIVSSITDELKPIQQFIYKLIVNRKSFKLAKNELNYKNLIKYGNDIEQNTAFDPREDLAILQYTGGMTGIPKGAMITHYNLISQITNLDYWMAYIGTRDSKIQDSTLGVLPLSHFFGLTTSLLLPIFRCDSIVLIPNPRKLKYNMKAIQKYNITYFFGVPAFFQKLAEHSKIRRFNWSSLRCCISMYPTLYPDTVRNFESKTNALLVEGYGLAESIAITHLNPLDKDTGRHGIGIPLPNLDVKLVDINTGEDIPLDSFNEDNLTSEGELLVKGPQIMKGYWNQQDETDNVITKDGWLKTGVVTKMNDKGYFFIVDRLTDCIYTFGFQVWPLEVETCLCNHPDIDMAAAIPVKDENCNEVIKIFIVQRWGAPKYTQEELRSYCKENLAPYKVPKYFEYRENLPLSPVGKVLRRPLRENIDFVIIKEESLWD